MTERGDKTRAAIVEAGLVLAADGLQHVTGRAVARRCGITHPNVRYYFASPQALLDAVAGLAVERGDTKVIARLKLDNHPAVI